MGPNKGEYYHQQGQAYQYRYARVIFHGRQVFDSCFATAIPRRGYEIHSILRYLQDT